MMPQILLTEVLHPDQPFFVIVKIDQRRVDADSVQEVSDRDKSDIFQFVFLVFHQDQRGIGTESNSVILAIGTSFFERADIEGRIVIMRKPLPRIIYKQIQRHTKSVRRKVPGPTSTPATTHSLRCAPDRTMERGHKTTSRKNVPDSIRLSEPIQQAPAISTPSETIAELAMVVGQFAS